MDFHETQEPVYITKNGTNDLVILSNEAYEKSEDIKITNKVEEIFNKKYSDFEAFKNEIYEKINTGLKQLKKENMFLQNKHLKNWRKSTSYERI